MAEVVASQGEKTDGMAEQNTNRSTGGSSADKNDLESSVETATEAREPPPPDIADLCRETFRKTAEYMQGELASTAEDYKLLECMNKSVTVKAVEMKDIAHNIECTMRELNAKYKSLEPYLEQIDQIEKSVGQLEQATYQLDAYSKRLEAKFKQLEKR